jgi:hypothetical protein
MQIILDNGNVEFYVDDVLGATDTYSTLSGWGGFIRFGSPAGGPYMDAFYDDLTVQTGYAPIYSDDFGTDTSANYTVTESNNDATVVWAADYSASGLGPAPNTADGTTTGVRTAVNTAAGVREALSIISNQTFSGNYTAQIDYAWDFAPSSTTEYRIFGINHSGAYLPNYWQGGAPNPPIETDGYFSGATADGGATTDYFFYEGDSAAVDTGSPAGLVWADDLTADANRNNTDSFFATVFPPSGQIGEGTWNTVQMTYYNDNVYYFESGKLLAVYNDPDDTYTTGSVNFGHEDAFTSIGATNYIYWDNLQVLQVNAAPEASATTATLNFGSQVETSNTVLDTAIDSTGGIPVAITGVTITGTDAAAYAVTTQPASYPVYRANGSALNLQVTFTPPGADNYDDATLEVTTDDPGNPTISIDLQGSGLSSVNDWMLMDN